MTAGDEKLGAPALTALTHNLHRHELGHILRAALSGVEYPYYAPRRCSDGGNGAIVFYFPKGPSDPSDKPVIALAGVAMTAAVDTRIHHPVAAPLADPHAVIGTIKPLQTCNSDLRTASSLSSDDFTRLFRQEFLLCYAAARSTANRNEFEQLAYAIGAGTHLPYFDGRKLAAALEQADELAQALTVPGRFDFTREAQCSAALAAVMALPPMRLAECLVPREAIPSAPLGCMMEGVVD